MPNAGWPERVAGRIMYPATADYFADYAVAFCQAGAAIIGGCCGTTPEHIAQMRASLDAGVEPCLSEESSLVEEASLEFARADLKPTELERKLSSKHFVLAVEMDPPRSFSTHKLIAGASLLAEAGADVINVADSPMARMRMSPWAACQLIQRDVGMETVLHFPTRGRNLLRVQGDMLAAHAMGVRNIFVVMGDPTAIGDYPEAMDNYDLVPSGLISLIQQGFNSGVDLSGADIGEATSFFVGCALNLSAQDPRRELRLLRKKIQAGADFALTQPVYEPQHAAEFISLYQQEYGEHRSRSWPGCCRSSTSAMRPSSTTKCPASPSHRTSASGSPRPGSRLPPKAWPSPSSCSSSCAHSSRVSTSCHPLAATTWRRRSSKPHAGQTSRADHPASPAQRPGGPAPHVRIRSTIRSQDYFRISNRRSLMTDLANVS